MTVTYSLDVASSTFCGIHKLLFRWKGSIWKSIWPELLLWCFCYGVLSATYRFCLDKHQQTKFEDLCVFFYTYGDYIPITFMLGFYVSAVFGRWKEIFDNLGWIDSPSLLITCCIKGNDETVRNIRRNIVRYMVLVQAMVFRDISTSVKKRFPTMDHLVTAGLMTENELKEFDSIISPQLKYWVPMNWIFLLIRKAREMNYVDSDIVFIDLLEKMRQYRVNVLTLTLYDWVPVPLVYTQVVNLAVRSYFVIALMGRQYLISERDIPNAKTVDLYVPVMSILQFLFYIGWMKVAEVLLNPLGDDDDDFECNWVIDRNLQVGLSIVDDAHGRLPALEKDIFWNDILPEPLYTAESASRPHNPCVGSCNDLTVDESMILQPRRRRFMSVATVDESDKPHLGTASGLSPGEIPVPHHSHPMERRASSIDHYSNSERNNKLLASFRRKLSRTAVGGSTRRGQKFSFAGLTGHNSLRNKNSGGDFSDSYIAAYADWYDRNGHPGGPNVKLESLRAPDAASRWNSTLSRNSSVCSSNFIDGLQTPFAQSLPAHILTQRESVQLDAGTLNGLLEQLTVNEHPQPDIQKSGTPVPPTNAWTVNEMLPVIEEEENERGRKRNVAQSSTRSSMTTSVHSNGETDSNKMGETTAENPETKDNSPSTPPPITPPVAVASTVARDTVRRVSRPSETKNIGSQDSLERLKNILRAADSVSTEEAASITDSTTNLEPAAPFESEIQERSAPANLAAEAIQRPQTNRLTRNRSFGGLEADQRRDSPTFRLSDSSDT